MRPRGDLRIPSYTEARPRVSYGGPQARLSAPGFGRRVGGLPPPARQRTGRARWLGPGVAAALLTGWIAVSVPAARAAALDALTPLAAAMGLAVASPSIEIAQAHARRAEIDGQTLLYVEGDLVNKAARAQKPPALLITITGTDGQPLYAWKTRLAAKSIDAAKSAPFQTRLLSPPETFRSVSVSIVNEG